jgi:hypothetical protein
VHDGLPRAVRQNTGWATVWHARRRLGGGSTAAKCCRDRERVTGKVPGKEERVGAQRNGGSTVRRRKRHRAAAFVGGEGASVGGSGGCGVLQHRRGKGVRKLQEITGIGSLGRSSPGSGGRWRCSAGIHETERLPVAGGSGLGAGSGGES